MHSFQLRRNRTLKIGEVALTLKPTVQKDSQVTEKCRFVTETIWGEESGLFQGRDSFTEINNVTQMLKLTIEGGSEVTETCRRVGVTIWSETEGLLLSRDCLSMLGRSPIRSNRRFRGY